MVDQKGIVKIFHEDLIMILGAMTVLFVLIVRSSVELLRVNNQGNTGGFGGSEGLNKPGVGKCSE
jgi:hypothetical protein